MIGADMYADKRGTYFFLNEGRISEFLDERMALESKPILDYCFTSSPLRNI